LSDAVSSLRRYAERADLDPARLSQVEQRMEAVLAQARRFRVAPEALPEVLRAARDGWMHSLPPAISGHWNARRRRQNRNSVCWRGD